MNKQQHFRLPFSKFTFENWQNVIILSIIVFYSVWLSYALFNTTIQAGFSGDYLAFWSAGKIADEKGYTEIYKLDDLKIVQLQELDKFGLIGKLDPSTYSPLPVALFPIFVLPFQFLSRISIQVSYWLWTIINLIVLSAYLIFFSKEILPGEAEKAIKKNFPLLIISYPVWMNFIEGQVEILLVICTGEFIRQAMHKKPFVSGFWLGGLLLKPQLIIFILPALLFLHNWKTISGFILSSFPIILTSYFLSGFAGMRAMLDLWLGFSAGMATNNPEAMINWRMIGLNINSLFGTSFGWLVTGLGMVLTTVLVYLLLKRKPTLGSAEWIITMAAVFSATLAVTWHSHYHMAVVMIPFLVLAYQFKLIPSKMIFAWSATTPLLFLIYFVLSILILIGTRIMLPGLKYLVAISGFALNLLVFYTFFRYFHNIFTKTGTIDHQLCN